MYRISKGVDRPPEVMGIRGMKALVTMAGSAVGLLLLTMIVIATNVVGPIWAFMFFLVALIFVFYYLVQYSSKYGERGFARFQATRQLPKLITVRSSSVYKRMQETKSVKPHPINGKANG